MAGKGPGREQGVKHGGVGDSLAGSGRGCAGRLAAASGGRDRGRGRGRGGPDELARLFPLFDEGGPSRVELAVLEQQFRTEQERSCVGIWSGLESARARPTLACYVGPPEQLNSLDVELRGALDEIDAQLLLDVLRPIVDQSTPVVPYALRLPST